MSNKTFFFQKKSGHQESPLIYLDKYQTYVSTCPSAPIITLVDFKKHLIAFSLTSFVYALKMNLQLNKSFKK